MVDISKQTVPVAAAFALRYGETNMVELCREALDHAYGERQNESVKGNMPSLCWCTIESGPCAAEVVGRGTESLLHRVTTWCRRSRLTLLSVRYPAEESRSYSPRLRRLEVLGFGFLVMNFCDCAMSLQDLVRMKWLPISHPLSCRRH